MAPQTFSQPGSHTETLVAPAWPELPASPVFGLLESLLLAQPDNDTRSINDARKALRGHMCWQACFSTEPESQRVIQKSLRFSAATPCGLARS